MKKRISPSKRNTKKTLPLALVTTALLFVGVLSGIMYFANIQPGITMQVAAQAAQKTYTLEELPFSDKEIINPQRGMYKWRNSEQLTESAKSPDEYDRFDWKEIEKSQGVYDFSVLESRIVKANNEGRKFSFRVRDLVQEKGSVVPKYAEKWGFWQGSYFVPDYNNPQYQERVRLFLKALGDKYDGDPRISYVDMGMYGKWGEYHVYNVSYPNNGVNKPTTESIKKVIDSHVDAFPNTQLVQVRGDYTKETGNAVIYAFNHPRLKIPMGVRNDCLGWKNGHEHFRSAIEHIQWSSYQNRWKVAPFITEYCGSDVDAFKGMRLAPQQVIDFHVALISNGNIAHGSNKLSMSEAPTTEKEAAMRAAKLSGYRYILRKAVLPSSIPNTGTFNVTTTWSNIGVTPAYWDWNVELQLRKPGTNTIVWKQNMSKVKLRCSFESDRDCILPTKNHATGVDTPRLITDTLNLQGAVAAGTYDLAVQVVTAKPDPYWKIMKLANKNKTSDDAYLLGQATVGTNIGGSDIELPPPAPGDTTPNGSTSLRIQAEDYTANYDLTPGNNGYTEYRTGNADIGKVDSQLYIRHYEPTEWLSYDFNISTPGKYIVYTNYATTSKVAALNFQIDDQSNQRVVLTGADSWRDYRNSDTVAVALTEGAHTLKIQNVGGVNSHVDVDYIEIVRVGDLDAPAEDNSGGLLPIIIEAEDYINNFDLTSGNNGYKDYRSGNADIGKNGNLIYIRHFEPSEWLTYNFTVKTPGKYAVTGNFATRSRTAALSFQVDAQTAQKINLPAGLLWSQYKDSDAATFNLTEGNHVLKVQNVGGSDSHVDLNSVQIVRIGDADVQVGKSLPGKVEAEDFDTEGKNISYYDRSPGNAYNNKVLRPGTDVDVNMLAGMTYVGNFLSGEWMNYTANVSSSGKYDLKLRYSTEVTNARIAISVNGRRVKEVSLPATPDWLEPRTMIMRDISLPSGAVTIKLEMVGGQSIVDYFIIE